MPLQGSFHRTYSFSGRRRRSSPATPRPSVRDACVEADDRAPHTPNRPAGQTGLLFKQKSGSNRLPGQTGFLVKQASWSNRLSGQTGFLVKQASGSNRLETGKHRAHDDRGESDGRDSDSEQQQAATVCKRRDAPVGAVRNGSRSRPGRQRGLGHTRALVSGDPQQPLTPVPSRRESARALLPGARTREDTGTHRRVRTRN